MKPVLRIGIEAQRVFRRNSYGMDIVAIELIKALQRIDQHNQYFIFCRRGGKRVEDVFPSLQDNFHIIQFSGGDYIFWEQFLLPQKVKAYKLDLLHCTANTAPLNIKLPIYLLLHDVIYLEGIDLHKGTWYQRLGNLYRKWIVPKVAPKAAFVGTVSYYEKENILQKLPIKKDNIKVFHNAVSDHFKAIPIEETSLIATRAKHQLPGAYFLLFYNADPRKNFVNAIKAYISYRKSGGVIRLCILNSQKRVIKNIIVNNQGKEFLDTINFIGYVNNADLVSLYFDATAFLFLSTRESFGIPVLEAMACGTPVICSNVSSMPEVAGEAALLVDPMATNEISDAMHFLANKPAERERLSKEGIMRATDFSWDKTAQKWINSYHALQS